MLAKNWDPVANDPKGWLMSEKLDGVRCFWNGRNMYTRNGNLFYPPDWFKELPPRTLLLMVSFGQNEMTSKNLSALLEDKIKMRSGS